MCFSCVLFLLKKKKKSQDKVEFYGAQSAVESNNLQFLRQYLFSHSVSS